MQRFFDEIRQPVFHSDARPQISRQHGTLLRHISMAAQTSDTARNCFRVLASELMRTNAAPSRLCSSGSASRASASPTLRTPCAIEFAPTSLNRSANLAQCR